MSATGVYGEPIFGSECKQRCVHCRSESLVSACSRDTAEDISMTLQTPLAGDTRSSRPAAANPVIGVWELWLCISHLSD